MATGWKFNFGNVSGSRSRVKIFGYLMLAMLGVMMVAQRQATEEPALAAPAAAGETEVVTVEAPAPPADPLVGKIVVVKVVTEDLIDGTRLRELRQLLIAADEQKAAAIVFEINTNAGYDAELAGLLLADLAQIKTQLHTFVKPSALGMGALLALGSNTVYMTPASVIGAATPSPPKAVADVEANGEGSVIVRERSGGSVDSQTISILIAQATNAAKSGGQRPELASAFISSSFEFKLQPKDSTRKVQIVGGNEILTLTAEEALVEYEDGPLLAKGTANSVEDVIAAEGLEGEIVQTSPRNWTSDLDLAEIGGPYVTETRDGTEETPFGKLPEQHFGGKILVVPIGLEDLMSEARFEFMARVLEKARAEKPTAVIFDMHSPGGYAWYTTDIMMRELMRLPFPTYTYVNTKAKSAGALIAIATDHIYMAPVSTIGAALVVTSAGDIEGDMDRKIQADMESTVKNVAKAKGHDPDVCLAFVTEKTEVVRDGAVLCRVGEVLDFNALEATKDWDGDGKPILAKGLADSIEHLIEQEGLKGEIIEVYASPFERFAQWTQIWGAVLILFGLAGGYLEAQSPGFGVPGIVSIISFAIYFIGNYVAGNLAGWETVTIFIIGAFLILLELFVFSGTLVLGLAGGVMMLGALVFALVNKYDLGELTKGAKDSDLSSGEALSRVFSFPLLSVSIAIVLTVILIAVLMRFLPQLKPVRALILETGVPSGTSVGGLLAAAAGEDGRPGSSLLGKKGVAETDLRPSGMAKFGAELLDATTESEFIPRGAEVKVVAIQGNEIVVTKA
ncbi:MAG: membrane-bound serine protease (ClpP class) [Verrucomicrobiales bacterium]|jgi:membrane-bound serine protease (ClpP class)